MTATPYDWLSLNAATRHFGYSHKNSLTTRLRQLRRRGLVIDLGTPPASYPASAANPKRTDKVVMLWPHPKTALIRSDAPIHLLNAKRGRRPG